ncbi:MAG: T9SS type A sorting domain-containing protein [Clostridiales bacterium]
MNLLKIFSVLALISSFAFSQTLPPPMVLDVGNIHMKMDAMMGDGGLQSQFSWDLAASNSSSTEIFYWPRDEWKSNMLYQIFNPLVLDDSGILDIKGIKKLVFAKGDALTNYGKTVWAQESRRYRPPVVIVDGNVLSKPYTWKVDPNLKSDIKIEFEDMLEQFGLRSHVEIYAFSNPLLSDFFIWKATHKFTGEQALPSDTANYKVKLPDQTIRFWWPISFSFGPTKAGERYALGAFSYEGEDDYDSWIKVPSKLGGARDSLYIAYYRDANNPQAQPFTNGSQDDTGDPDRTTGHLYSTQVPGFTLLHADKSYQDHSDDRTQPYSMAHASIETDLWGDHSIGIKKTYLGTDEGGRFPVEPPKNSGVAYQKGPMRFITSGPYELTKNSAQNRYDSLTFVYAVGAGSIGWKAADSVGRLWLNSKITDAEKEAWVLKGRDSLQQTLDRANWTWDRMTRNASIPAPPPPPDIEIKSGKEFITVKWSYPDGSYFKDAVTGVDDWNAWRVYRKAGAMLTNDPLDQKNGEIWKLVYETTDRNTLKFEDTNVVKGNEYYYAVTAIDNGTQNTVSPFTGMRLESSRFINMSTWSAVVGVDPSDVKPEMHFTYALRQNYPNPFNPATTLVYQIPQSDKVVLKVFDVLGREVATLVNQEQKAGEHSVRFDGSALPSGIYIYSIQAGQFRYSRKLMLLK